MPYFSVVMPLYNKEAFVADAVRSVLAQNFADFELLIVDDASTDASLHVAESIDDPRIRIIRHEKNKGLSAARNTGIKNAAAKFVAFLDADDLWLPMFLEKIVSLVEEFPQASIFATGYLEQRRGINAAPLKINLEVAKGSALVLPDYFEAALYQPPYWFGSAAVRKSAFDQAGYFDETITFGEDTDWNIRANLLLKAAYLHEPHAIYRIDSQNQITGSRLGGRYITDFSKYETNNPNYPSLKKFLYANRYFLAMAYKMEGSKKEFTLLRGQIDARNLSAAQKMMLGMPRPLAALLQKAKRWVLRRGIRLTAFPR